PRRRRSASRRSKSCCAGWARGGRRPRPRDPGRAILRRMTNLRRLACLIAAAAAVALAHAQAPDPAAPTGAADAPPIPEYKVEVILFAYRDFDRGEERFDHRLPQMALATDPLERRPPPVFDESTLESLT